MKSTVVYEQMGSNGVSGAVVCVKGSLVAQVKVDGNWRRANTKQAAALFRNALRVSLLQPGDEVVGWGADGEAVLGTYCGAIGDRFNVCVHRDRHVHTARVLPLDVAVGSGAWPFRKDMHVAAFVEGQWVTGKWQRYDEGRHIVLMDRCPQVESIVALLGGHWAASDCAYTAAYALMQGLIQQQ